jgi:hypothetical protein
MRRPVLTEAQVAEMFDAAQVELLATICRLPKSCDVQQFGDGIRAAARVYARDKAASSSPNTQRKEIRRIDRLIERCTRAVSTYEELAKAIESLDPAVRHVWMLRQAVVADRMPSWRIPEPSELRDQATRKVAAQGLKALITVGGSSTEGRMRASGHRSQTWCPALQAPVKIPGKRQPRQEAARTLVMNLQIAVHEAGARVPLTAHHSKPGPFARMAGEVLLMVGATGSASAIGLAVQIINDLQRERLTRVKRTAISTTEGVQAVSS